MKNTTIKINDLGDSESIIITLPNKAIIRIRTHATLNEISVTHSQREDEKMFIKPYMGNCFEVVCGEIKT